MIVLGMHRSGTSLLAEIVHRWGAYAGKPESLLHGDQWNARGYWESAPLVTFNQNLLRAVDAHGWRPPADEADSRLIEYAGSGPFRDRALDLLATMRQPGKPWFWKDPRLGVLMPFWTRLWGEAVYVIPVRNPLDVASSLASRDRTSLSAALLLWQRYMSRIVRDTPSGWSRLFIEYESLLTDSAHQVFRLTQFLNDQTGVQGNDFQYARQAIDHSLRHHEAKRGDAQAAGNLTNGQKELYGALRGLVYDGGAQTPAATLAMPEKWREYLSDPRNPVPAEP